MKFLRKVLAVCLAVVFLTALVIGAGIILSVQNVNVTYVYYDGDAHAAEYAETRGNLDKLKGSGLLFIGREDIEEKITDGGSLALESFEKVYPCTINIVIRERVETFALKTDGAAYAVYDEKGLYMRTGASAFNAADGCPDVSVYGADESSMPDVARICGYFGEIFSSFRRMVGSVTVTRISENDVFEFNLRSGFIIRIYGWNVDGGADGDRAKLEKAYEKYSSLSDAQKLGGVLDVISGKDGGEPSVIFPGYPAF